MERKHYLVVLVISLWGLVFLGPSKEEMTEVAKIFNTGLLDVLKAIVVGVVIGIVLRINSVRAYLNNTTFGSLLTSTGLCVIGLGAIGIGILGAVILYFRLGEIELVRVPLHAAVVGSSAMVIYAVSKVRNNEKI